MLSRQDLLEIIDEKITDIFLEYQEANNVPSGDLSFEMYNELEEIEKRLMKLIIRQGQFASGVTYTPCYSEPGDITFIMKETLHKDESTTMECIGWHFGEPCEEDTLDPEMWCNLVAELL